MMNNFSVKKALTAMVLAALPCLQADAQGYTQNFDNVNSMTGWEITNNSAPTGTESWLQGIPSTNPGPFDAYDGANNSYIAVNYQSTGNVGTISNWLFSPNRTYRNGDVFTFFTRKSSPDNNPDRLEVRLSTNGSSTNAGSTATSVGDFTTQLLTINQSLTTGVYPTSWTMYTITISGLPAPTSGRIAFRYFVTDAGISSTNGDYIGIDNVVYTPYTCPAFTMTPAGPLTGGSAGVDYSYSLSQTGALGAPNYAVTAGALPPGVTLSASGAITGTPTATGTFNFVVTVSDASGCSESNLYSITIVCPVNPTSLNGLPMLCSNGEPVELTAGSPAGGTYSGTGVTGSTFDPAAGTQTITYDYTDPYGCAFNSSATITVNEAPEVTQTAVADLCSNGGIYALTGASPTGGTYTGTGVAGNTFDPAVGSQTLNYAYTDANGCSDNLDFTITVNEAPEATQASIDVCSNIGLIALTGATPEGGTYAGTGVTGTDFDPAAGTQTLNYAYTDANGCSDHVDFTITVNEAPEVTQTAVADLCINGGIYALTGASPAGGTYTGTGVTGTDFDPAVGSQTLNYAYMDANGCSDNLDFTITVNEAPEVTHTAIEDVCFGSFSVQLTGGTPTGGAYIGTGVTGGFFNPMYGSQTLTYTYTDANGCSGNADFDVTVLDPIVLTFTLPVDELCVYNNALELTGGMPAGGTYTGTAVTDGSFNPATAGLGNHTIVYTYTDAHNCTMLIMDVITVEECLGLTENTQAALQAYPNPGNGLFTIATEAGQELTGIQVFDVQGKLVESALLTANGLSVTADLTKAGNGMYFLKGMLNGTTVTVRLVKQ